MSQPYYQYVTGAVVNAQPDERAGWVLVGTAWAYPSRIWLQTEVDGFGVLMLVLVANDGPQICRLIVQQPQMALGPPLTQRVLRKISVEHLVGLGVAQVRRPATIVDAERGWYRVEGVDGIFGGRPVREGRGSRTSDERLAQVAGIYMRAVGDGRPPVQAVAAELPCSRSHAGRLVAQARAAGQLRRTSPGRASATELQELTLVGDLPNDSRLDGP
jgi:hypothetical protein